LRDGFAGVFVVGDTDFLDVDAVFLGGI
jgi:hypothetical protein